MHPDYTQLADIDWGFFGNIACGKSYVGRRILPVMVYKKGEVVTLYGMQGSTYSRLVLLSDVACALTTLLFFIYIQIPMLDTATKPKPNIVP